MQSKQILSLLLSLLMLFSIFPLPILAETEEMEGAENASMDAPTEDERAAETQPDYMEMTANEFWEEASGEDLVTAESTDEFGNDPDQIDDPDAPSLEDDWSDWYTDDAPEDETDDEYADDWTDEEEQTDTTLSAEEEILRIISPNMR